MQRGIAAAFAAIAVVSTPAAWVRAQERQIVYYSPWSDCIGNPATPPCALDTLFSCMVRSDWGMCADVGVVSQADCRPRHVTGVRYIVERIEEKRPSARLVFRAEICRDDRPCREPETIHTEDLTNADGKWRFRSSPQIYRQACASPVPTGAASRAPL